MLFHFLFWYLRVCHRTGRGSSHSWSQNNRSSLRSCETSTSVKYLVGDRHATVALVTEFLSFPLTFGLCLVAGNLTSLTGSVAEKGVNCRRLKDQLDTLEKETTDKLAQMDQYNKELKVSGCDGLYIFILDYIVFSSQRLIPLTASITICCLFNARLSPSVVNVQT